MISTLAQKGKKGEVTSSSLMRGVRIKSYLIYRFLWRISDHLYLIKNNFNSII